MPPTTKIRTKRQGCSITCIHPGQSFSSIEKQEFLKKHFGCVTLPDAYGNPSKIHCPVACSAIERAVPDPLYGGREVISTEPISLTMFDGKTDRFLGYLGPPREYVCHKRDCGHREKLEFDVYTEDELRQGNIHHGHGKHKRHDRVTPSRFGSFTLPKPLQFADENAPGYPLHTGVPVQISTTMDYPNNPNKLLSIEHFSQDTNPSRDPICLWDGNDKTLPSGKSCDYDNSYWMLHYENSDGETETLKTNSRFLISHYPSLSQNSFLKWNSEKHRFDFSRYESATRFMVMDENSDYRTSGCALIPETLHLPFNSMGDWYGDQQQGNPKLLKKRVSPDNNNEEKGNSTTNKNKILDFVTKHKIETAILVVLSILLVLLFIVLKLRNKKRSLSVGKETLKQEETENKNSQTI